jgi:hypothetical protein
MGGKKQGAHPTLSPAELTALREIHVGLAIFVPARQVDLLISRGLASRRLDGGVVLKDAGLLCLKNEREWANVIG